MTDKYKIIEVVDSEAIAKNTIFDKDTIITLFNDTSKFKIGDGKTAYNALYYIGGNIIQPAVQSALDAKLTATTANFNAKLTATKAVTQAASTAIDVPGLLADFNALLVKLKTAGIML